MSEAFTLRSGIDVKLISFMGGDHMVVAAAKVSTSGTAAMSFADGTAKNDKGEPWSEKDTSGLVNYLMQHRHGTPFEHSTLTFFVNAPIFVWREWHRHRIGFSYNEESARYKTLSPVFYIPPEDRPMMKVDDWKPGRPKFTKCEDAQKYDRLLSNLHEVYSLGYTKYLDNLSMGFDPGLARDCLPVGIYSSCWVTCNPRSLMAFLSLRTHDETAKFVSYPLYEIEVAARSCEEIFKLGWPLTYEAFVKHGRVGP